MSFYEEWFYVICTIASCESIPKLKDRIWMKFISEETQMHMVLLSVFLLHAFMWINIYLFFYYWYMYMLLQQFFDLSLLNV